MAIEDLAQACALPGLTVVVPADGPSAEAATKTMLVREGPTFLRCGRVNLPVVYGADGPDFEIGKATTLRDGDDVAIVANGIMVAMALDAAEGLAHEGISARVLDMHTVKPIDVEALEAAAATVVRYEGADHGFVETRAIVVAEEHIAYGGLGSTVAIALAERSPVRMSFVDLGDTYATSGTPEELLVQFGLTPDAILDAARRVLKE
jgi:transketolase